jgi:hypothetical protein
MKMDCVLYEVRAGSFYILFTAIREERFNVSPNALLRLQRDLNFGLKKTKWKGKHVLGSDEVDRLRVKDRLA